MTSPRVPAESQPLMQLEPNMRVTLNVADVSRLHPVLCHYPELVSDVSIRCLIQIHTVAEAWILRAVQ